MGEPLAMFSGFPTATFQFLKGISQNNEKAWFEAHRADYEAYYVEVAKAFVATIGPRLRTISKTVQFEPRVNGSLFRINRDVRFSKGKSPYKTHLDLWFWEGKHRGWDAPGFFFRMFADKLILGAGMHAFEKTHQAAYRAAVVNPKRGGALVTALDRIRRAGPYEIGGATRKKVPQGFDPSHERAGLLLHDGLWATLEVPVPKEARASVFVDWCFKHYKNLAPVSHWLLTVVGTSPKEATRGVR